MIGYEGAARYHRLIYALTGDDQIVPPGLNLESDRPEYSRLKDERLFFHCWELAAVGNNYPIVGVHVPQANVVAVVWVKLLSLEAAVQNFIVGLSTPLTQDTVGTLGGRDTQVRIITQFYRREQAGAPTTGEGRIAINTGYAFEYPAPWVLRGTALDLVAYENRAAATATTGIIVWGYERTMRPEEVAAVQGP